MAEILRSLLNFELSSFPATLLMNLLCADWGRRQLHIDHEVWRHISKGLGIIHCIMAIELLFL